MAQTANILRAFEVPSDTNDYPVKDGTTIYKGAAVGINAADGMARQLAAGDKFVGFAEEKVDNSAGADGDKRVVVKLRGVVQLSITSAAATDIGKAVYASDSETFTLTQSTNTYIGVVHRWVSTGVVMVKFDAEGLGELTELTDSTTGTAGDTIDDSTSSVKDDLASIAAKVNTLIRWATRS